MSERYEIQTIKSASKYTEYRITDTQGDDRVATCFDAVNAQMIVSALNGFGELLEHVGRAANMLRGMTIDPAIPQHAKEAMVSKIEDLDAVAEKYV